MATTTTTPDSYVFSVRLSAQEWERAQQLMRLLEARSRDPGTQVTQRTLLVTAMEHLDKYLTGLRTDKKRPR